MKKLIKRIFILAMCLSLAVPATSVEASSSAKSKAEYPVKQFYKYAKTLNLSKMSWYVAEKKSGGDSISKSKQKILLSILRKENSKRFSYSIISTTLSKDKKSATIKVKVKYRSLYEAAYRAMVDTVKDFLNYYYKYGKEPSTTKTVGWLLNNLKKEAKKHPGKSITKTITLKTKKYKDGWKIVKVPDAVYDSYTCNISKGMDAATRDISD